MTFGDQMRVMRAVRGWTLRNVAEITGIDQGTLSRYERGLQVPERNLPAILAGYQFPPEGLRKLAFGILDGTIETKKGAAAALEL